MTQHSPQISHDKKHKTTSMWLMVIIYMGTVSCSHPAKSTEEPDISPTLQVMETVSQSYDWVPPADGFDFPLGPPDGKGYYNAQPFGRNFHLGDDLNGIGGGNTDLGDTIYSIATGRVFFAEDIGGGWGNVVRVAHNIGDSLTPQWVEALYAHMDTVVIANGALLHRGQALGTIGTAGGTYLAHLHLEIRTQMGMPIGGGYSDQTEGFVSPSEFIRERRE